MTWIALLGIVLQLVGLGLAIRGIADTYRELVGKSIWPALAQASKDWIKYDLLRCPRPTVQLSAQGSIGFGSAGSITAHVGLPEYDDSAEVDVRLAVLARSVGILEDRISGNRTYHEKQINRVESQIKDQIKDLVQRVDQANSQVAALQHATIGREGKGLVKTLAGFLITVVGVFLTIAGLPF